MAAVIRSVDHPYWNWAPHGQDALWRLAAECYAVEHDGPLAGPGARLSDRRGSQAESSWPLMT